MFFLSLHISHWSLSAHFTVSGEKKEKKENIHSWPLPKTEWVLLRQRRDWNPSLLLPIVPPEETEVRAKVWPGLRPQPLQATGSGRGAPRGWRFGAFSKGRAGPAGEAPEGGTAHASGAAAGRLFEGRQRSSEGAALSPDPPRLPQLVPAWRSSLLAPAPSPPGTPPHCCRRSLAGSGRTPGPPRRPRSCSLRLGGEGPGCLGTGGGAPLVTRARAGCYLRVGRGRPARGRGGARSSSDSICYSHCSPGCHSRRRRRGARSQSEPQRARAPARMSVAPPSYCFVAFPPRAKDGLVVFGKNSARPRDEVQEVVYIAAADHEPESKVECTYISIDQVPRTHAIVISRPAWLWGAEMGANEHGVCIANEAISTREPAPENEALLGMDLVRLGLERGTTAKEAFEVIVSLLEEHGQGGNYYEDGNLCHTFQSAYLIVDREEAWVLETIGKHWAAEKITEGVKCICNQLSITSKIDAEHPELRSYAEGQGWWTADQEFNFSEVFSQADDHLGCCSGKDSLEKQEESITVQTMMNILRDKASGVCVDSDSFLTTASIVSVLPQEGSSPCIHYFTGTPDPSRSIFKPFIFVDDVKLVPKVQSPCFGEDDPAKKEPRFLEKPDRRHELYKAHEWARAVIESDQDQGHKLMETMLDLEKQGLEAMESILSSTDPMDPTEVADLFYDCVDTEIKFFK